MDPEEPPDLLGAPFYDEEDLFWAGEQLKGLGKRLVVDVLGFWVAFTLLCARIGKALFEIGHDFYPFSDFVKFIQGHLAGHDFCASPKHFKCVSSKAATEIKNHVSLFKLQSIKIDG